MNRGLKILVKKDLLFSVKLLPVFIVCSAALPIYGGAFAHNLFAVPFIILSTTSILSVLFYLSAICHLEDNPETEGFLDSLPMAKETRVFARYIATLLLIIASMLAAVVVFILAGGRLDCDGLIWSASVLLMHYAVFLYVFYRAGLQTAQYLPAFLFIAGAVSMRTGVMTGDFALPAGGYEYGAFAAAVVVYALSAKYSAEK